MKYLIVSDIHGAIDSAEVVIDRFVEEKCDYILCLGDILYHGPRNDLPEFYKPKEVIKLLNEYSDKIIAIKGNCEAEVDQMVLNFKINDSLDMNINGLNCHLEHGHHLDETLEGDYSKYDVILYGHTHIPDNTFKGKTLLFNPGSITLPKNGSKRSYAIWDNKKITLYDILGDELDSYTY